MLRAGASVVYHRKPFVRRVLADDFPDPDATRLRNVGEGEVLRENHYLAFMSEVSTSLASG